MLKKILDRLKTRKRNEDCYRRMEEAAMAVLGRCCGIIGGDAYAGYLQHTCVKCKYRVSIHSCKGCVYSSTEDCYYLPYCGPKRSLYLPRE